MSIVTTWHTPHLDNIGTQRAHELLRRAAYGHEELTSEPVSSGLPRTVAIIRTRETAAGSSAAGIPATYATTAGLGTIAAALHMPPHWKPRGGTVVELKDSERGITLVDIPATANDAADTLFLSDKLQLADPIYGASAVFTVEEVIPIVAGIIRARIAFAHAGAAPP